MSKTGCLTTGEAYIPCSYGAMVEQREAYYRKRKGASSYFVYDCNACQLTSNCPYPDKKGKGAEGRS